MNSSSSCWADPQIISKIAAGQGVTLQCRCLLLSWWVRVATVWFWGSGVHTVRRFGGDTSNLWNASSIKNAFEPLFFEDHKFVSPEAFVDRRSSAPTSLVTDRWAIPQRCFARSFNGEGGWWMVLLAFNWYNGFKIGSTLSFGCFQIKINSKCGYF